MTVRAGPNRIILRSPQAKARHGRTVGHDEREPRWPVYGALWAMCSCSALIVHEHEDGPRGEVAGMTCTLRSKPAPCVPEATTQRMADGRAVWRCRRCRGLTTVLEEEGR